MYNPTQLPWRKDESLVEYLEKTGVPRRDFLKFCGEMAIMLGLASAVTPKIAKALASIKRPPVVWLSLQECTGCVESILRSSTPSIGDLLLDTISLDFQENLMAAESRIRDVDMAQEMTNLTKLQILQQSGTAMLAQANQASASVLSLLQG